MSGSCFDLRRALRVLLGSSLLLAAPAARAESVFQVFPSTNLYPKYRADPRRPEFGVAVLALPDPRIPGAGDRRVNLKLGGRFGLLRVHPEDRPEGGWQLDIEAGFTGQFDIDHSLDNVGWDGIYNFLVSTTVAPGVAVQAGTKHISSHVGDEYAERTGRRRIEYTREEVAAGVAWNIDGRWRTYGEVGWGIAVKNEIGQAPGRLQFGLEHEAPGTLPGGRVGWYAAADLQSLEERDWQLDASLQVGLLVPAGDRRWRVGLGYRDGQVPLGEFFQVDEPFFSLGLWLDP